MPSLTVLKATHIEQRGFSSQLDLYIQGNNNTYSPGKASVPWDSLKRAEALTSLCSSSHKLTGMKSCDHFFFHSETCKFPYGYIQL